MSTAKKPAPEKQAEQPQDHAPGPAPARLFRRALLFLALLCLALAGLWLALPHIAQKFLVPELARALRTPGLSIDIRRADFSGLDLGDICLSPDQGLKIRAVLINWSLPGLLQGRIDKISILGLEVNARKNGEKWEITGLPEFEESQGTDPAPLFVPEIAALHIDGQARLDGAGLELALPFSVSGSLDGARLLLLDAQTSLAGQEMDLRLTADVQQRNFRLTFALPPASIAALSSLIPGLAVHPLGGTLQAMVDAVLPPDKRPRLKAELGLDAVKTILGGTALTQEGNTTANLVWQDEPQLALSPLNLLAPLHLTLTVDDITASIENMVLAFSWNLALHSLPGIEFSSQPSLAGRTELQSTGHGVTMRTEAKIEALEARLGPIPDLALTLHASTLTLNAVTNSTGALIDGAVDLGNLRMTQESASASISGLNLTWNAAVDQQVHGVARVSGARLEAGQSGMALTATRLDGQCDFLLGEELSLNGTMNVSARAHSGDVAAVMTLRLPLAWPVPATTPGSVNIDLNLKGKGLAKIASAIAQDLHGFGIDGSISVLPVGIRAPMKGHIDTTNISRSWAEIKVAQTLTLPGNLAKFAPAAKDLAGTARLDATARLDMSSGQPTLPSSMKITALSLAHSGSKITLNGGAVVLTFSNLLNMRSDPGGRLNFDRLQLGTIILEQGDIPFQIEARHSILVEGCRFQWAGGRIGSQAFRVNPGVEDYTVELYCDRVEMAQALEQFGLTQAQGGGTANGRIPVRYSGGTLTFDNGFLYSTPGEKGILRVKGTEILTAGVPQGTPQYGQLDLAAEALKDFSYDWARIRLNTQKRELIVSLELDGKPEKPLPFTYDREFGGFVRVAASSPGSVFQGIRVDVNFRLPLDQLLQYRQLLELMKNGG